MWEHRNIPSGKMFRKPLTPKNTNFFSSAGIRQDFDVNVIPQPVPSATNVRQTTILGHMVGNQGFSYSFDEKSVLARIKYLNSFFGASTNNYLTTKTVAEDGNTVSKLTQLQELQITRKMLTKYAFIPDFRQLIKNGFARVSTRYDNNVTDYIIVEILNTVTLEDAYEVDNIVIDRALLVRHGAQESILNFNFLSNQKFTEFEFQLWRRNCIINRIWLPSLTHLERKKKDIKKMLDFKFTEESVELILKEKSLIRKLPINPAREKACLVRDSAVALQDGDFNYLEKIKNKIANLDAEKKRPAKLSLADQISVINCRNRRQNLEIGETAHLDEIAQWDGKRTDNPFTRRITKPRLKGIDNELQETFREIEKSCSENEDEIDDIECSLNDRHFDPYSLHDFNVELNCQEKVKQRTEERPKSTRPYLRCGEKRLTIEEYRKRRKT